MSHKDGVHKLPSYYWLSSFKQDCRCSANYEAFFKNIKLHVLFKICSLMPWVPSLLVIVNDNKVESERNKRSQDLYRFEISAKIWTADLLSSRQRWQRLHDATTAETKHYLPYILLFIAKHQKLLLFVPWGCYQMMLYCNSQTQQLE